jgi:S-adenosyl-L-methionine hydrolase (adenosine-forming)
MFITLTTDFGNRDGYAAIMKGVALSITPRLTCIDISHEIEPGDIRSAAWVIANAYKYFPDGTVHVIVVDPEVGTNRRAVVVATKRHTFVCPDNGVLTLVLKQLESYEAFSLTNKDLCLPAVSSTFHGRDIFAPAAAHIAGGRAAKVAGPPIDAASLVRFREAGVAVVGNQVEGSVVYIDHFGNLITNIPAEYAQSGCSALCAQQELPIGLTYGSVSLHQPLAYVGSHGYLEVGVNGGSAKTAFGARCGTEVTLRRGDWV